MKNGRGPSRFIEGLGDGHCEPRRAEILRSAALKENGLRAGQLSSTALVHTHAVAHGVEGPSAPPAASRTKHHRITTSVSRRRSGSCFEQGKAPRRVTRVLLYLIAVLLTGIPTLMQTGEVQGKSRHGFDEGFRLPPPLHRPTLFARNCWPGKVQAGRMRDIAFHESEYPAMASRLASRLHDGSTLPEFGRVRIEGPALNDLAGASALENSQKKKPEPSNTEPCPNELTRLLRYVPAPLFPRRLSRRRCPCVFPLGGIAHKDFEHMKFYGCGV